MPHHAAYFIRHVFLGRFSDLSIPGHRQFPSVACLICCLNMNELHLELFYSFWPIRPWHRPCSGPSIKIHTAMVFLRPCGNIIPHQISYHAPVGAANNPDWPILKSHCVHRRVLWPPGRRTNQTVHAYAVL